MPIRYHTEVRPMTLSNPVPAKITEALTTIQRLLLQGEEVKLFSYQVRLRALAHRRVVVVATPMRLIIFKRRLIGGYDMADIRWQDLRDARINESLLEKYFGAHFMLFTSNGKHSVSGLNVEQARQVYVFCQQQEQEWREKNRIRTIEEDRAKAGGVYLPQSSPVPEQSVSSSLTERLRKAKEMLSEGLISDAEFETIKARVVNEL
ncbi:MAG TPA: hypothetical protein DCR78_20220 [Pseudomonas sp.]|nr:hypothetical protein [Pseudomonas sp.]HAW22279.1 hypothetical protein [Pseudomonas sp.]|tara:strand:+ start:424 stop:1041 length:618 start_codon:yes stop_codon:yes gene_type:complete